MRRIFFILLGIIGTLQSFAQEQVTQEPVKSKRELRRERLSAMAKQDEEGVITYKKQTVFGVKLISDGYGASMEIGRAQSINKLLLFQLEISERKSPKEMKESNPYGISNPLIYGKENFFYPIKLGVQQQVLLGNKSNKSGVQVTANYGGGIALGLLRPYYTEIIDSTTGLTRYAKYDSPDSLNVLNPADIIGGPDFGEGWSDLKLVAGAYAKTALRLDYGGHNDVVSAIEVGLVGEYYGQKIPLIVYVKPKQFFLSAYVSVMFGSRK
jgi:hypothetical protein